MVARRPWGLHVQKAASLGTPIARLAFSKTPITGLAFPERAFTDRRWAPPLKGELFSNNACPKGPLWRKSCSVLLIMRLPWLQYPNGMTVGYTYVTRGRLTDIHNRDAANVTLDRYTYTHDTADNITQVVDAATAKWVYAYDNRYRLTQAERYLGTTLKHRYTYGYDAADNVTAQAVYNATAGTTNSTAYTYNAGNELTQAVSSANGVTAYTYDSWGRLATITRGTQSATLGWAYQDRLKSYTTTLTGERSQNFSYTGDGRRNALDNALLGAKTWSYDQNWGVRSQSYTSYPDYSAWYILEPGGTLLASAPASGVATTLKYYVKDHLGSTRSVRLENTTRSVGFEYDPYGGLYASSGVTGFVQDRFTGHEFDIETNLYWAPYRYYRPDMLRWISRDPLGMVDGPNVYGYVGGRTISSKDKSGLGLDFIYKPDRFGGGQPHDPSECTCVQEAKYISAHIDDEIKSKWNGFNRNQYMHNAMRHCLGQCKLAKSHGQLCAQLAGWYHEVNPTYGYDLHDMLADIHNNTEGRKCAKSSSDCAGCCLRKLSSGELDANDTTP